jgi:hypothetical protein
MPIETFLFFDLETTRMFNDAPDSHPPYNHRASNLSSHVQREYYNEYMRQVSNENAWQLEVFEFLFVRMSQIGYCFYSSILVILLRVTIGQRESFLKKVKYNFTPTFTLFTYVGRSENH